MKRLVLLLLVGLGYVAFNRLTAPRSRPAEGAFPFPTAASHEAIVLDDPSAVAEWCGKLGCEEAALRRAVAAVGKSADAVRDYLERAK